MYYTLHIIQSIFEIPKDKDGRVRTTEMERLKKGGKVSEPFKLPRDMFILLFLRLILVSTRLGSLKVISHMLFASQGENEKRLSVQFD